METIRPSTAAIPIRGMPRHEGVEQWRQGIAPIHHQSRGKRALIVSAEVWRKLGEFPSDSALSARGQIEECLGEVLDIDVANRSKLVYVAPVDRYALR